MPHSHSAEYFGEGRRDRRTTSRLLMRTTRSERTPGSLGPPVPCTAYVVRREMPISPVCSEIIDESFPANDPWDRRQAGLNGVIARSAGSASLFSSLREHYEANSMRWPCHNAPKEFASLIILTDVANGAVPRRPRDIRRQARCRAIGGRGFWRQRTCGINSSNYQQKISHLI